MLRRHIRSTVPLLALMIAAPSFAAKGKSSFSPTTAACIKKAAGDRKLCLTGAAASECTQAYHAAYAACFNQNTGVACATTCESTRSTCENVPQAAEKVCAKGCTKARKTSLKSCAAGDVTCAGSVQTTYAACKKACGQTEQAALLPCRAQFTACVAQCPSL